MSSLAENLKQFLKGEVADDPAALTTYSRDASLLEVRPQVVVFPKDTTDVENLVTYVGENKEADPSLSITPRAAGSCMSGGPLGESIILDVMKYLGGIISWQGNDVIVRPGTYYRDFEKETLARGLILPCYTASKNLNAIGGMVANNSAGEKTLEYGKMENFVKALKVVFADGKEYEVKPLSKSELDKKMTQRNFEGLIYKKLFKLIENNREIINAAKPQVSKNSAGYYLWNVWNGETFDLTKLIVGSQGTLGIVTEATIRLVPVKPVSKLFAIFMKDISKVGELVNEILPFHPESIESYDDSTMKLALKFLPEMIKTMHPKHLLKLGWSFLPELGMILTGGIPKLILLVEFSGTDSKKIDSDMKVLQRKISHFGFKTRIPKSEEESEKYWTIRHESFNLLRKHVQGKRTAPFIDDVIVQPKYLPEFLPKMRKILDDYKLFYTIAGHAGNGNFHIIPLMDMKDPHNAQIIPEVSQKIYDLVLSYKGSITAEHNDGIIRTPFLRQMYGDQIYDLFKQTKEIFDPQNIFNPGKKVGGTMEYLKAHIVKG